MYGQRVVDTNCEANNFIFLFCGNDRKGRRSVRFNIVVIKIIRQVIIADRYVNVIMPVNGLSVSSVFDVSPKSLRDNGIIHAGSGKVVEALNRNSWPLTYEKSSLGYFSGLLCGISCLRRGDVRADEKADLRQRDDSENASKNHQPAIVASYGVFGALRDTSIVWFWVGFFGAGLIVCLMWWLI